MAWRCSFCGQIVEGSRVPSSFNCPVGNSLSSNSTKCHCWRKFESALDKQNKLLEEQNQILDRQNKLDAMQMEAEKQKESLRRFEKELKAQWDTEEELAKQLGLHNSSIIAHSIRSLCISFTNNPVYWVYLRDGGIDYDNKFYYMSITPENSYPRGFSEERETWFILRKEYSKAIENVREKTNLDAFVEYLECFRKSSLMEELRKVDDYLKNCGDCPSYKDNTKCYDRAHALIKKYGPSLFPERYLSFLDEEMMKQDGKRKLKTKIFHDKLSNRATLSVLGLAAGLFLFLIVRCLL